MSTQSNGRQALSAIMGTVQTTAHTVSNTIGAVNQAVGMLNKSVSDAAERQTVSSTLNNAIFVKTLHQEKAKELTESRIGVKKYMSQSEDHRTMYESSFNELAAILNPPETKAA
jgi:hypothetical protein